MYEKFGQFINGKWQKSSSGETYEVINPATEEIIGKASKAGRSDVEKALKSAEKGLKVWRKIPPWQRSYILRKIADKMREKIQNTSFQDPSIELVANVTAESVKTTKDIKNLLGQKNRIELSYEVKNIHRAVGTRLSHYIYKKLSKEEIEKNSITINLLGSAGQSLGAFGIKGLKINVIGDANDYVGKLSLIHI